MRVDVSPTRNAPSVGQNASLLAEWRVGAIVQAVAVRDGSGQLWLRIGNVNHPARVASGPHEGPENGEVLQARVLRTSPVLALEALASSPSPSAEDDLTSTALRLYLPRQTSAATLMANLSFLVRGAAMDDLPANVQRAVEQLWKSLPDPDALSHPQSLQRALLQSGSFLEAALARGMTIPGDLKAQLLDLQRAISAAGGRPNAAAADLSPPSALPTAQGPLTTLPSTPATLALLDHVEQQLHELARQTEGTLARLTATQVQNASLTGAAAAMMIELPVRLEDHATMLRLRIEREAPRHSVEYESGWTIEAALDLGVLGGLHARVSLRGQTVGVQLRAESPQVVEQLNARGPELAALLRSSGLSIDRVVCLHGMPASDGAQRPQRLLDVRA